MQQTRLKLTNGHKFTGAEFRALISLFNHSDKDGRKSHPGLTLMVEETDYGRTTLSEAITSLKQRGWIHETYKGNGLSGHSSVFDLVPDAPNPDYRCGLPRCATCSNSSAVAEPLAEQPDLNSSAVAEALEANSSAEADIWRSPNSSAVPTNSSAVAEPIVRLEPTPTDPGSDPEGSDPVSLEEQAPPSDPEEVRYSPNHDGTQVEAPFSGKPLRLDKGNMTAAGEPPSSGQGEAAGDIQPSNQSQPAAGEDLMSGSDEDPWGNPFDGQPEAGSVDPFAGVDFDADDSGMTFQERELAEATLKANQRREELLKRPMRPEEDSLSSFIPPVEVEKSTPAALAAFNGFDPFA